MTKSGKEPPKSYGPLTPDPDQYKWLTSGLEFLKFDADNVKDLYDAIGSVINLVSGVVSVVGAVSSMVDLCQKLGIFKATKDDNTARLQKVGEQVQAMYEYLEAWPMKTRSKTPDRPSPVSAYYSIDEQRRSRWRLMSHSAPTQARFTSPGR